MPKNLTATDVALESIVVVTDEAGAVTGLTSWVNVDYQGAPVREQFDLWAVLDGNQRTDVQALHDSLSQALQNAYLA